MESDSAGLAHDHQPRGSTAAESRSPQPQEIIDHLDVDSDNPDDDSTMGSEVSSVTTSLRSEGYEFRYENGRRYQSANGTYHLPNDVQEMDRLELQHLIWIEIAGGRYHLAPLKDARLTHVLDVGTGTGNWAIEFANLHPKVKVIGTDLSPIQPDWVPSNCEFFVDDAAMEWAFHERFDYVHGRALTMGIANWDHFVDQAYKVLQPGGFLELQEFSIPLDSPDDSVAEGSALWTWGRKVREVCAKLGIDSMAATKHADRLRDRGFQDVNHVELLCPLGPWAKGQREKRLGYMARKDLYEGIDAISKRLFILGGDSEEEVDLFLARCREELLDPAIHIGLSLHVVWGQRPE
ncbi:S-adenosyl-L-methionine-dependent methyltransferase [Microdochium trichocladiopsis]|uniref:S-adenosyl-L-methionine-dependent methyltransferase n=1 Tax=Microdochium trichocladiopsis TaxID=1682393 RepID=A0A9P9BWF8_9PEZI|nr:S-adenosyl-L-methionine-dependent methyltransferase [Microdochium trichocladiopsis]KAH7040752.1 S-adenosyl-L-methionine-dependent methyltransferase [Microdochium trichocladiopsis]